MRDFGIIPVSFWQEAPTKALSNEAKLVLVYLLAGPHASMSGVVHLPLEYIATDLDWTVLEVEAAMDELISSDMVMRCYLTNFLAPTVHLRVHGPCTLKVTREVCRQTRRLPSNCTIKAPFTALIESLIGSIVGQEDDEIVGTVRRGDVGQKLPRAREDEEEDEDEKRRVRSSRRELARCTKNGQGRKEPDGVRPTSSASAAAKPPDGQRPALTLVPSASADEGFEPVAWLPLVGGGRYPVQAVDLERWKLAYPQVEVMGELRRMIDWLDSNPRKRKTERGARNFITSWLRRNQDRSAPRPAPTPVQEVDIFRGAK